MLIEIIFMGAASPKVYDCILGPYEKGSYTCFTLKEINPATGYHRLMRHRTKTIFSIGGDHIPHVGTTLAAGKAK